MKKMCVTLFLLCCTSFSEAAQLRGHHLGLGASQYMFLRDLKEQFDNTAGVTLAYKYTLPMMHTQEPTLGLRLEYFVPKKDGFKNENILIAPEFSVLFYNNLIPLGLSLGMDVNYWKQSKSYIHNEVYHEDVLYGFALGFFSRTDLAPWGHLEYSLSYHFQQFDVRTTFLAIGLQYVWDF